jgi:hypothetical protein
MAAGDQPIIQIKIDKGTLDLIDKELQRLHGQLTNPEASVREWAAKQIEKFQDDLMSFKKVAGNQLIPASTDPDFKAS